MTRTLSMIVRVSAIACAMAGALACTSSTTPHAASSGMDLALMGSAEAKTNVHVLLKSNGQDGEKRDISLDVNGTASETFKLEPGEHVMAIVCTDEHGNELLGTGTATFETKADTNLMILVDVDSLIDGEEVPAELIEEVAEANGDVNADADADADANAETETDANDAETDADANANVDVNVEDGNVDVDVDADANASAGDTNADANTDADADANTESNMDASVDDSDANASADASASAGIAVVASSNVGGGDNENECDETCQAECLEELLHLRVLIVAMKCGAPRCRVEARRADVSVRFRADTARSARDS